MIVVGLVVVGRGIEVEGKGIRHWINRLSGLVAHSNKLAIRIQKRATHKKTCAATWHSSDEAWSLGQPAWRLKNLCYSYTWYPFTTFTLLTLLPTFLHSPFHPLTLLQDFGFLLLLLSNGLWWDQGQEESESLCLLFLCFFSFFTFFDFFLSKISPKIPFLLWLSLSLLE